MLFLARESGRLLEASGDHAESLWLSTPPGDRRRSLPAPTEKAWAVAFKINVAITVVSEVFALSTRLTLAGKMQDMVRDAVYSICLFVVLALLTYALSWCVLRAMSSCSKRTLQIGFVGFVVPSVMLVNWLLVSDAMQWAIVAGFVIAGVSWAFVGRGRLSFAAANLKVAALAVRSMPKVFIWSLGMTVIRLWWLVATGTALAGFTVPFTIVQGTDGNTYPTADCETILPSTTELEGSCVCNGQVISEHVGCILGDRRLDVLLACYWMASMGWGFVVFTNIITATVARSVSSWVSTAEDVEPVWRSCQCVINSSLGALCKGAAIDGVILTLNQVTQRLPPLFDGLGFQFTLFPRGEIGHSWRPKGSFAYGIQPFGVVFGLPILLVKLVSNYLQGYASVFVGMHRASFSEAAGRTKALFLTAGMTLFINEVGLGVSLLVAGLAPIFLYIYAASNQPDEGSAASFVLLPAALTHAAFVVFLLPMMEVVMCAYKAVFVAFVQDPTVLSTLHDRQLHDGLSRAWRDMQLLYPARTGTHVGVAV